uniref:hypothetical protein n=1 Tax=Prevotella sp. TaxID=59823 RepID=UPI004029799A
AAAVAVASVAEAALAVAALAAAALAVAGKLGSEQHVANIHQFRDFTHQNVTIKKKDYEEE